MAPAGACWGGASPCFTAQPLSSWSHSSPRVTWIHPYPPWEAPAHLRPSVASSLTPDGIQAPQPDVRVWGASGLHFHPLGAQAQTLCELSLPLHVQSLYLRCPFKQPSRSVVQVPPPDRLARKGQCHTVGLCGERGSASGREEKEDRRSHPSLFPVPSPPPPPRTGCWPPAPRALAPGPRPESAHTSPGVEAGSC